jgi:hypothetical protein
MPISLTPGSGSQLGDAQPQSGRAEFRHDDLRDGFGEPLEQRMRIVLREGLDARDDGRVVERVLQLAGHERLVRRQRDLEVETNGLRQMPLPVVDTDARFQAQVVDEYLVHCPPSTLAAAGIAIGQRHVAIALELAPILTSSRS